MIKHKICLILLIVAAALTTCCEELRNPFACSHSHSITAVDQERTPVYQHSDRPDSSSVPHETGSEWKVIAEKDDSVIMQHTDGSIREITLGKK